MGKKIMFVPIGELKEDDMVFGTDGLWHNIDLQQIHIPNKMYRIHFIENISHRRLKNIEMGYVDCSGTHEWTFVSDDGITTTFDTETISNHEYRFIFDYHVGTKDGPYINYIEEIKPKESRCILVKNSDDNQFCILLNKNEDAKNNINQDVKVEIY